MCGIFGVVAAADADATPDEVEDAIRRLFRLSESRGKESAGLAAAAGDVIRVLKQPIPASRFIRTAAFHETLRDVTRNGGAARRLARPLAVIGHSRLVTNGAQENNDNNQPVIAAGMVGIHNGIICNDRELWGRFPDMPRRYEVDTEVLLSLLRRFLREEGSLPAATRRAFGAIEGCAAVSLLFDDLDHVLLATNNGSLYLAQGRGLCVFASEAVILGSLLKSGALGAALAKAAVVALPPGEARLVSISDATVTPFSFRNGAAEELRLSPARREIRDLSARLESEARAYRTAAYSPRVARGDDRPELLREGLERIESLRRCTRCVLPASFPFIDFDGDGVCSYCRAHRSTDYRGRDALEQAVAPYRGRDGQPDCLVGVSGGRDSCYGIHYVKRELGLSPIAYTYDWGMVTDLARRNVSRMCAALGVEHILISANINWKRDNIRKNVTAWLKKPDLGMIPLFMAGDKQFYYFANQLKRRTGIKLFLFCAGNRYETTDFKIGFCGIGGGSPGGILTSLSARRKAQLFAYYAGQCLSNPAYLNRSIWDTAFAFFASYMMPHDYLYLFHYVPWDEESIMKTLVGEYNWEVAADTVATWRIGDGTAAFYNYLYYTVAGFTEMDTFRSHQVRDGALSREEALRRVRQENQPRYESIKWYFNAINLDIPFNDAIRTINAIPKRF